MQDPIRDIVEACEDLIWSVDRIGRVTFVNGAVARILGRDPASLLGRPADKVLSPLGATAALERALSGDSVVPCEASCESRDGVSMRLSTHVSALRGTRGEVCGAVGISRDITARFQIERQLRASNELFRLLAENATDLISLHHLDATFVYASPASVRVMGYTPAELQGRLAFEFIHGDDRERVRAAFTDFTRALDRVLRVEFRVTRKDGTCVWLESTARALPSRVEEASGELIAVSREVTQRKRDELTLRSREQRQAVIAALGQRALGGPVEEVIGPATDAVARALGVAYCYILESLPSTTALRVRSGFGWRSPLEGQELTPAPHSEVAYTLATGGVVVSRDFHDERRFRPSPNLVEHGLRSGIIAAIGDARKSPFGILGAYDRRPHEFTRDDIHFVESVTSLISMAISRAKSDEEMRKSHDRFEKIFAEHPDAVSINSLGDGRYHEVNPEFCARSGFRREEVIGRTPAELGIWNRPEDLRNLLRRLRSGAILRNQEAEFRLKNGSLMTGLFSACVLEFDGGPCVLLFVRDITDRKRFESERTLHMAQFQKLAEASLRFNATLSAKRLLRLVSTKARACVGAHVAVTRLTADDARKRKLIASSVSVKYAETRFHDGEADATILYSSVSRTNRPLRLTPAEIDAVCARRRALKFGREHPLRRGLLIAPLLGQGGRQLGLIQLFDKAEGEFTEHDEVILLQLARIASVALENAQLVKHLRLAHDRLKTVSERLVEAQESERRDIALELHDEIGQILTGLTLTLEVRRKLPIEALETQIDRARRLSKQLMERMRAISLQLRPRMLDDLGLVPALLWNFEEYQMQTGVEVLFEHDGLERRFPMRIETAAYRIVQEALTNVARHARARRVGVRMWADAAILRLEIEDDGRGFDPDAIVVATTKAGLAGMRERAALLGGYVTVESKRRLGTRVAAELPLPRLRESRCRTGSQSRSF